MNRLCFRSMCAPQEDTSCKSKCWVEKRAEPLPEMVEAALSIAKAIHLDVGGIEYLVDERDNLPYVYDINALSNFVADAHQVVGFDPFVNFVDYLI